MKGFRVKSGFDIRVSNREGLARLLKEREDSDQEGFFSSPGHSGELCFFVSPWWVSSADRRPQSIYGVAAASQKSEDER